LGDKYAVHAGHDFNFIARSGCGEWFLESGVPNYSTQFGDIVGGVMVPAIKVLMHLSNPNRRGMHLISSIDESFRTLYLPRAYDQYRSEKIVESKRRDFGLNKITDGNYPHSRYYRCRDGVWVSINAVQKKHWDTFCEVVDRAQWKDKHADTRLVPEMEKLFQDAPSTYWEALAANRELCLFRVVPWVEHVNYSQARPQLSSDPLSWAGFAPHSSLLSTPELGRDTFTVLHGLGIGNKEIAEWIKQGIVFHPDPPEAKAAL
jgi:crotonobetainyl-CoA:carnitine CoA-transferase CaiB-like acyl-CoA transferase